MDLLQRVEAVNIPRSYSVEEPRFLTTGKSIIRNDMLIRE